MPMIVDRRLDGRHKSAVNRRRLMRRYKSQIKKAVNESVSRRSITDTDSGEKVNIPARDITEPTIYHGSGGRREQVHPGNREFNRGDQVERPQGQAGGGSGEGEASDSGEGEDEFQFEISRSEYLEILFEDLELPNLVKTKLVQQEATTMVRAGYSTSGVASNLALQRTMQRAKGRKIAIISPYRRRKKEILAELEVEAVKDPVDELQLRRLQDELKRVEAKMRSIPFIDNFDLRFNQFLPQPKPVTQAVMFCIMDVSGSMTQPVKEIAKRFFMLLYLFLSRSYEKTEVVFIRHHTVASEVDEENFFYSRETGGTIVSSALNLTRDIIEQRYPSDDWNIYAAQASDGDNWASDSPICRDVLMKSIMPLLQYYAYVEIHDHTHQSLWTEYEKVEAAFDTFAMKQIKGLADIYPVFHELFKRQQA